MAAPPPPPPPPCRLTAPYKLRPESRQDGLVPVHLPAWTQDTGSDCEGPARQGGGRDQYSGC